jgi:type II secretory pathway component PulM
VKPRTRQALAWTAVILALALVSWSYLRPDMIVDLATRAWACF